MSRLNTVEEIDYGFNQTSIDRTVRYMSRLQRALSLNIHIHRPQGQIDDGDIYLFNHFARFETFIPQYLIYKQSGILSRSVASSEFFSNPTLARYLRGVGAVPNNHPRLLPFLAAEILKGRKVVIFPEGGMVKDRRVLDDEGQYSIYSRTAQVRRKHHSGAAVLAQMVESFKLGLVLLDQAGDSLEPWAEKLDMTVEDLRAVSRRPTRLVPGNITFYPLRVDESAMFRATEGLAKLKARAAEELLIESNILLRNTDMDLRLGASIHLMRGRSTRWHADLLAAMRDAGDIDSFFALAAERPERETPAGRRLHRLIAHLRNDCMPAMYAEVTLNLSHMAASLIRHALSLGIREMPQARFHRALFLAIRALQKTAAAHLHRGLSWPERYAGIIDGTCIGFNEFLTMAEKTHAIEREPVSYRFRETLMDQLEMDAVRRENPVQVYANEAAPVPGVMAAVAQGLEEASRVDDQALSRLLFNEERAALSWARHHFSHPTYADINRQETATANPEPYWLTPERPKRLGVVLVHGLLASPAELAEFGQQIAQAGYPVIGVRLQGHGSSPWDLKQSSWLDWLASILRGIRIITPFVDQICLAGFSTGAALSLIAAARHPPKVTAVVSCSAPYKMRNRNLVVVPFVHSANEIVRRISERDGLITFRPNQSEHPNINYHNIPISALNELRHMIDHMDEELPRVAVPTLILQGSNDHVVDSDSAGLIAGKMTAAPWKRVVMIESERHGILNEDIGETRGTILKFLQSLCVE
jgi:esterase/lipase